MWHIARKSYTYNIFLFCNISELPLSAAYVSLLLKLLQWPKSDVFIGLDLTRMALSKESTAEAILGNKNVAGQVFDAVMLQLQKDNPLNVQKPALKCLANLFHTAEGIEFLMRNGFIDTAMSRAW